VSSSAAQRISTRTGARRAIALACVLLFSASCATRRAATAFRVLPARPDYLLRSPDSKDTPFPEILGQYTNVGPGWVELRPGIGLRVENAYFREGAPKHGLANFLGTEIVTYRVLPSGVLEQTAFESRLERRPSDQPPAQQLLSESQKLYRLQRLFYQVVLNKRTDTHNAVLLSASSVDELDLLTNQLMSEPQSVCGSASPHCTVFPEACTASLEIDITVDGARRTVPLSTVLADVTKSCRHVGLNRQYLGGLVPVRLDPRDLDALRVPLLPEDRVKCR